MNNKDKLNEELIKQLTEHQFLLEMAYGLKDIYRKIDDKIEIVIQHLILCIVFTEVSPITINHWKAEVYNNIHRMWKVKGNNKLPTYNQLKTNCIDTWSDSLLNSLDNEIKSLSKIENLNVSNYDVNKLYNCIISYFEWLFTELSQSESVSSNQVFDEIEELKEIYKK
jgi:hypothetical protein